MSLKIIEYPMLNLVVGCKEPPFLPNKSYVGL